MHLGSGAPKSHTEASHRHSSLSRDVMVQNTKIIRKENDTRRLPIYEALIIQQKCPIINNQDTGSSRTLKLLSAVNTNRRFIPPRQRNMVTSSPPIASSPPPIATQQDTAPLPHVRIAQPTAVPSRNGNSPGLLPSVAPSDNPPTRTDQPFPRRTRSKGISASQPTALRPRRANISPRAASSQPTRKAPGSQMPTRRSARIRNMNTGIL